MINLNKLLSGTAPFGFNGDAVSNAIKNASSNAKGTSHEHESDGKIYLTNPPKYKCKVCGEYSENL